MLAAPTAAIGTLALLAAARPEALPAALPLAALWFLAPEIAAAVSQPRRHREPALTDAEVEKYRLEAERDLDRFDEE